MGIFDTFFNKKQVPIPLILSLTKSKFLSLGADGKIYINRGLDGGLSVGNELAAFGLGQAITDPDTGLDLGAVETALGKVRIIEVEEQRSVGKSDDVAKLERGVLLKFQQQRQGAKNTFAKNQSNFSVIAQQKKMIKKQKMFTLAVGTIKINSGSNKVELNRGQLEQITNDLIVKLSNSNRFTVMERQKIDEVLEEKLFETQASGGSIENRLQHLQGADYVIHGEINNFYLTKNKKNVPYLNETIVNHRSFCEATIRIVNVHDGSIVASDKVYTKISKTDGADLTQRFSRMIDQFTTDSVFFIQSTLYPIKVLGKASNGLIFINYGENANLKVGQIFEIMRPGEELIDPDTGFNFGSAESKIGTAVIDHVEKNRSQAKLMVNTDVRPGDIFRKPQKIQTTQQPEVMKPQW